MSVKITREEYRRIKQMNREEMERFISRCLRTEPEESIMRHIAKNCIAAYESSHEEGGEYRLKPVRVDKP